MRPFIAILFGATVAAFAGFAGCSTDSNSGNPSGANVSVNVSVGSGANTCHGSAPDGTCDIGANPEDCACQDCFLTAMCKKLCKDDGNCEAGVEDCSCVDCLQSQDQCEPDADCDDNGDPDNGIPNTCTSADACTCSECLDAPQCQACNNDGLCDVFTEGCNCNDCNGICQGSSSSTTGPGGGGGMGGNGGAAASTAASSAASTVASSAASSTAAASSGAGGAGGN